MESETSTFDDWLWALRILTSGRELTKALGLVAAFARKTYGAHIWFVEIMGKRWSYLAGEERDLPSQAELERIQLDDGIGMVVGSWGSINQVRRQKLCEFLNAIIAQRAAA